MESNSRRSRRNRLMLSNSFETKKVREIDRKESNKSRGHHILCLVIIEEDF